jgi:hypothetical protein
VARKKERTITFKENTEKVRRLQAR